MMAERDYILAPPIVTVSFSLEPVWNALDSMWSLTDSKLSGFSEWVTETARQLPPDRLHTNRLVFEGLTLARFSVLPAEKSYPDFVSYINAVAVYDAVQLRDELLKHLADYPISHPECWLTQDLPPTAEQLLNSRPIFVSFTNTVSGAEDSPFWSEVYDLLNDPARLKETVVSHLRWMWDEIFAVEWERVLPLLKESIAAFERLDFSNLTAYEAIRIVTGRDLTNLLEDKSITINHVCFVPSAHIGPYVVKYFQGNTLLLLFGARLPRGAQVVSSALTRAELLIRLSALADDARLRILELLTRHEELCAQDIIEHLNLSQSSVSRHLKQLSATGHIKERRKDVAKCYSLNTDRVVDTLRALTTFLSRQ
jgi:DNA-binding transcriptional ArsR family regulator